MIKQKQPFFDWLVSLGESDKEILPEFKEGEVYLLPEFDESKQIENRFKKNYEWFFEEQLNNWWTDETV